MIDAWTWPAYVGILLGAAAFAALFVPILVWESRRMGQIRLMRVVGAAAVAVYGVALIAYTLLPVPDGQWCAANPSPPRNLKPLSFVGDLLDYYRANGVRSLLRSFVFLQVVFNVVLFLPFGGLWRRYFGGRVVTATLLGFCASVAIEVTQTTGALGLLPCAYRVGDVDDVFLNTTGALIGAALAGALFFFVPDARSESRRRGRPRSVTRSRRLVGMLVDYALLAAVQASVALGWRATQYWILKVPANRLDEVDGVFWGGVVGLMLVVVAPWFTASGASLGQRTVWLTPGGEKAGFWRHAARSLMGFGGWALLSTIATVPGLPAGAVSALQLAASVLVGATFIALIVDRSGRGLSFRAAGLAVVDSRA